jgi:type IV secretion system protein VirB9
MRTPILFLILWLPAVAVAAPEKARTVANLPMAMTETIDSRIVTLDYDEAAVVRLEGCVNFQTMVTFGAGEHIENVGLGDSSQWQVMPNKRADLLFVKPLSAKAYSNMTVVSDKHVYNFELRAAPEEACDHGRAIYELRFNYPPDPAAIAAAAAAAAAAKTKSAVPTDLNALPLPEKRNTAYTYNGNVLLVPLRVFDDGASTYMKWADGTETPAVYALGADGTESIINYANRGDYLVIEQVARAFVLRRGKDKATLYNDAYHVQGLDADSPKPRKGGR